MPKIIKVENCSSCPYDDLGCAYSCALSIPADCPLPDAPDISIVKQLETNSRWLIDRIDEIHAALCPDKNGTWQERATQVVEAAGKVQADIARLNGENARLREALEKIASYGENGDRYCCDTPYIAKQILEGTE